MKRLYLRVRVLGSDPVRGRVVDADTGRDLSPRVPMIFAAKLLAATAGGKVDLFLWDYPPRIGYRRHRRGSATLREHPARLRIVERTA